MTPHGFIRMSPLEVRSLLAGDPSRKKSIHDFHDRNVFAMDQEGSNVLYLLDPTRVPQDSESDSSEEVFYPYPAVVNLLCGEGLAQQSISLSDIKLRKFPKDILASALEDFTRITQEQLIILATSNEGLTEILVDRVNMHKIQNVYWPFVKRLAEFVRIANERNWSVFAY